MSAFQRQPNIGKPWLWYFSLWLVILLFLGIASSAAAQSPSARFPYQQQVLARLDVLVVDSCFECDIQVSVVSDFSSLEVNVQSHSGDTLSVAGLLGSGHYFWRVGSEDTEWDENDFTIIDIPNLSGLAQWLVADSLDLLPGQSTEQWTDLSGEGNDVTQSVDALRPTLIESNLNGRRALRFEASDYLTGGDILDIEDHSIAIYILLRADTETFAVVSKGAAVTENGGYSIFPASGQYRFLTRDISVRTATGAGVLPPAQYYILRAQLDRDEAELSLRVNGLSGVPVPIVGYPDSDTDFTYAIGAYPEAFNFSFSGEIFEVMVFEEVLSIADDSLLSSYFNDRYSPPVNLGSDVIQDDFCPQVLNAEGEQYVGREWSDGTTVDSLIISAPGTYSVTTTDIFGRVSSDTIEVIYPGRYLRPFSLCTGQDSLWDTTLDETQFDFLWQDGSTSSSFLIDAPGEYAVQITDAQGCIFTSDTIEVTLDDFSVQATLGPDADLCVGNELSLLDVDTTGVVYTWTGGVDSPTLPITTSGSYDVTATNPNGCVAQDTIQVQVIGDAPVADFFTFGSCELSVTSFLNASYPPAGDVIESYDWQFGAGEGTSDLSDPDYLFEQAGDYLVELTVTTDVGCSSTVSQVITVSPKPSAMLDISLPCVGSETTFSDMSTVSSGDIEESLWQFDTNAFGSGALTQFVYSEAGTYDVRLITITEFGCRDTAMTTIEALNSPIASYVVEDVCLGQPSLLVAQAEENGGGAILGYLWQVDDEGLIFPEVVNTFNQSGPNPFTLTVTSVTGCTDDTLGLAFVYDAPIADFSSGPSCVGQPTAFSDETITSYDDAIVSYSWDFATQSTAATPSPTHIFTQEGSYDVLLQVTSATGCTDFVEKEVEVSGLPTADFDLDPIIGLPPLEVTFTDLSVGAEEYYWTFEGIGESTVADPVYTFLNEGVQPVTLRVVNEGGCLDSTSAEVFLTEPITDITLDFLSIQEQDGFLRPTIVFGNLGNYRLDSALIRVEVIGGGVLQELWTGALSPQQATTHELSSAILYDASTDVPQVCVTLSPMPGRIDVDPDNDQQCVAFGEIGQAIWERPSPNPTEGEISIRLINADEGTLRLRLTDETGRPVIDQEVAVGQQLVDLLTYDLSRYGSGQYYMTLSQAGREETYPIILIGR